MPTLLSYKNDVQVDWLEKDMNLRLIILLHKLIYACFASPSPKLLHECLDYPYLSKLKMVLELSRLQI